MRTNGLSFFVILFVIVFSSCTKDKIKTCVISATKATIQSNGGVDIEAQLDPDNSTECEYSFCYAAGSTPESKDNAIAALRNAYKISATVPPHFNSSSRYFFRALGTSPNGDFYGNVAVLDSIVANPNGGGCPLRPNMLDYYQHIYAYANVYNPEVRDGYLYIRAVINSDLALNVFLGGSVLKEGTYKTVSYAPLNEGDAQVSITESYPNILPFSNFVDKNNIVTVTHLTGDVYEVVICGAKWPVNSSRTDKLSTRFTIHT